MRVWDAKTHEKVLNITGHTNTVYSVDVSPDSTKFATGSADKHVFVWNIITGDKLVGPLKHKGYVVAVSFSPNGDRIATATAENPDAKSIRIYDSENGQLLLNIPSTFGRCTSPCLAWSADGRQLFAASRYKQVKRFNTSSGPCLAHGLFMVDTLFLSFYRGTKSLLSSSLASHFPFGMLPHNSKSELPSNTQAWSGPLRSPPTMTGLRPEKTTERSPCRVYVTFFPPRT